jgi:hypothetical protein
MSRVLHKKITNEELMMGNAKIKDDVSMDECIFVVGCDRSGTTLLQNLLNAHSEIFMTYELGLIYPFEDRYRKNGPSATVALARERGLLQGIEEFDEDAIHRCGGDQSFAKLMAELYRLQTKKQGKRIWGDKRPDYTGKIPRLAELFPRARFINLVRDPRAVAFSWAKTDWGPMTAYYAARKWKLRVQEARLSLDQLDPNRSLTVLFEDLVGNPESILKQICDFIQVKFDPMMLDTSRRKHMRLSNRHEKLHPNRSRPVNKDAVATWKSKSKVVLSHIETECHDEMQILGYTPFTKFGDKVPIWWKALYRIITYFRRFWRKKAHPFFDRLLSRS